MTMIEAMARVHDREEAAQRGEPDPWAAGGDDFDFEQFRDDRIACFVEAFKVLRSPTMWMCMAHGAKPWDEWTAYDLWMAMVDRAASPSIEDEFRTAATAIGNRRA